MPEGPFTPEDHLTDEAANADALHLYDDWMESADWVLKRIFGAHDPGDPGCVMDTIQTTNDEPLALAEQMRSLYAVASGRYRSEDVTPALQAVTAIDLLVLRSANECRRPAWPDERPATAEEIAVLTDARRHGMLRGRADVLLCGAGLSRTAYALNLLYEALGRPDKPDDIDPAAERLRGLADVTPSGVSGSVPQRAVGYVRVTPGDPDGEPTADAQHSVIRECVDESGYQLVTICKDNCPGDHAAAVPAGLFRGTRRRREG